MEIAGCLFYFGCYDFIPRGHAEGVGQLFDGYELQAVFVAFRKVKPAFECVVVFHFARAGFGYGHQVGNVRVYVGR